MACRLQTHGYKNCILDINSVSCRLYILLVTVLTLSSDFGTDASQGDRSWIFQRCLQKCATENCTNQEAFLGRQPLHLKLLQWDCVDECKYLCMWHTVDAFEKDNSGVPQFYGKWPFIRLFGMQEPASVLFSLMNGLSHLMIFYFQAKVPRSVPMYYVWHGMALVAINTWSWSTIFHTRDTVFTEMMDYFCALSVVLYNLFALGCRLFGTDRLWKPLFIAVILLAVYCNHIYYLSFVKFDYTYNMQVNISFGAINMIGWLCWCFKHRRKWKHVWKCAAVVIIINALLMLELGDFPPIFWTLDAHSLWHAGTAPLGILWYSFIIDDCLLLQKQKEDQALKLD